MIFSYCFIRGICLYLFVCSFVSMFNYACTHALQQACGLQLPLTPFWGKLRPSFDLHGLLHAGSTHMYSQALDIHIHINNNFLKSYLKCQRDLALGTVIISSNCPHLQLMLYRGILLIWDINYSWASYPVQLCCYSFSCSHLNEDHSVVSWFSFYIVTCTGCFSDE